MVGLFVKYVFVQHKELKTGWIEVWGKFRPRKKKDCPSAMDIIKCRAAAARMEISPRTRVSKLMICKSDGTTFRVNCQYEILEPLSARSPTVNSRPMTAGATIYTSKCRITHHNRRYGLLPTLDNNLEVGTHGQHSLSDTSGNCSS